MDIQDDSTPEAQEASADQANPADCEVSRAGASRHIEAYIHDEELCKEGDRQLHCQIRIAASSFMPADVFRVPAMPQMDVCS